MFSWIRNPICRMLRLPGDPHAPFGAADSIRVFRAGRNYYWLCVGRWAAKQIIVLLGVIISIVLLGRLIGDLNALRDDERASIAITSIGRRERVELPRNLTEKLAPHVRWVVPLVILLKIVGVASFAAQLVATYFALRLRYELRWYIVTDRSLRIRAGVWHVQETTMSFANLQRVEFSQGPLQRLLGIADLQVQSAGGGEQKAGPGKGMTLHTGAFEGVTNALEIRDLILTRLREYRDSGLGQPTEKGRPSGSARDLAVDPRDHATLLAAQEVLAEVKDLRRTMTDLFAKR